MGNARWWKTGAKYVENIKGAEQVVRQGQYRRNALERTNQTMCTVLKNHSDQALNTIWNAWNTFSGTSFQRKLRVNIYKYIYKKFTPSVPFPPFHGFFANTQNFAIESDLL